MSQEEKKFGLRDEDELTAVIVVLLAAALFALFFMRGCNNTNLQEAAEEGRVLVVDEDLIEFVTPPPNTIVISADEADEAGLDLDAVPVRNLPADALDEDVRNQELEAELSAPYIVASVAPTIGFLENRTFEFGAALIEGQGEPNTDVEVIVNGEEVGRTRVSSAGRWSLLIPRGTLETGTYDVVARSGDLVSDSATFTVNPPQTPRFIDEYETAILPGTYRVRGTADANWQIGLLSVGNEVQIIETDSSGNWEAILDLNEPGNYELQAVAIDPDGRPNTNLATDRLQISVVESLPIDEGGAGAAPVISAETDEDGVGLGEGEIEGVSTAEAPDISAETDEDGVGVGEATVDAGEAGMDDNGEAMDDGSGTDDDSNVDDSSVDAPSETLPTVVEQLAADGRFTTLLAAVEASGLGVSLDQQDAPVTLFAPTDEALANLPPGTLDNLLANPQALQAVLTEHVVLGSLASADIVNFMAAEPPALTNLAGNVLPLSLDGNFVKIANSNVTEADIQVSNGYIHAIDQVILPPLSGQVPTIDDSGVPIFRGTVLTVVGTAEPGTILTVMVNDQVHGTTTVNADGTWLVTNDITPGEYKIVAYTFGENGILQGISNPVLLTVE